VLNCTFRRNFGQSGGGLRSEGGSPSLSQCEFQENFASVSGGAIYAHRTSLTLTLTECRFLKNAAWGAGGGISTYQGTVSLIDCAFDENSAENGGAVYATYYKAAVLTGCRFGTNLALNRGGAVYAKAGPSMSDSLMVLTGCTFSGNTATRAGALYTEGRYLPEHAVTVDHCVFTGNWARDTGGALAVDYTPLTIVNSTFADNWAKTWPTLDWRCHLWGPWDDPAVNMTDCILWDREQSIIRAATLWGGQTVDTAGAAIAIIHSDVRGGWPGEGNIDADPLFASPGYWGDASDPTVIAPATRPNAIWVEGDYHLKSQAGRWDSTGGSWVLDEVTSPCIDAGDPNAPLGDEPEPNGGRINMGAYGSTAQASKSDGPKP
jgi:predicted outer membrane repeat protein